MISLKICAMSLMKNNCRRLGEISIHKTTNYLQEISQIIVTSHKKNLTRTVPVKLILRTEVMKMHG